MVVPATTLSVSCQFMTQGLISSKVVFGLLERFLCSLDVALLKDIRVDGYIDAGA